MLQINVRFLCRSEQIPFSNKISGKNLSDDTLDRIMIHPKGGPLRKEGSSLVVFQPFGTLTIRLLVESFLPKDPWHYI